LKITVCIKNAVDTEAVVALDRQGGLDSDRASYIIDPYSEFAVEKAIQLKEAGAAEEVSVLCIGDEASMSAVRHALAMGVDAAYRVDGSLLADSDSSALAKTLAAALRTIGCDLVMGGCKSADTASAQVMGRVAVILGIPHIGVATGLDIENGSVVVRREIDDGVEVVDTVLPAVVTAQQGLAEPRYPKVPDIMRSKKKPVTVWTLDDLGIDPDTVGNSAAKIKTSSFRLKPERTGGRIMQGDLADAVRDTVVALYDEAKVM
jgi:electron transfer flavoprotein beta subunit